MKRRGFNLVELLVVIATIGALIALLLPAIQSAREAARKSTCRANLRGIAQAWHSHLSVHRFFPSGGWFGFANQPFTGDPNRGFGMRQPGTWTYSILPYLERQSLHEVGKGKQSSNWIDVTGYSARLTTPIPSFRCPSRRGVGTVPIRFEKSDLYRPLNLAKDDWERLDMSRMATNDYCANQGSMNDPEGRLQGRLPESYMEADSHDFQWHSEVGVPGICYLRSTIRPSDIEDGLSNTYLVGERMIPPSHYDGITPGQGIYGTRAEIRDPYVMSISGEGPITVVAQRPNPLDPEQNFLLPRKDDESFPVFYFGSAHDATWNVSMCDGSVRSLSYDLGGQVHMRLGFRSDGLPID